MGLSFQRRQALASLRTGSKHLGKGWSTHPSLYVLVHYTPTDDSPNAARATCEWLEQDNHAAGSAMCVYQSLFDAYLDAAFQSVPGKRYHAVEARCFDPGELIDSNGGKLHTFMHCGWGANNGRLVMRRSGCFASLYAHDWLEVPADNAKPIRFEIGQANLTVYDRMREQAGLFAHSEAHGSFLGLCEPHRRGAVQTAIRRMPGIVDVSHEIEQMALYDPEAAQWHFLPISVFHALCEVAMAGGAHDV